MCAQIKLFINNIPQQNVSKYEDLLHTTLKISSPEHNSKKLIECTNVFSCISLGAEFISCMKDFAGQYTSSLLFVLEGVKLRVSKYT